MGNVFDIPSARAGTLLIGLLGYVLSLAFVVFEKFTLRWYFESARSGHGGARTNGRKG